MEFNDGKTKPIALNPILISRADNTPNHDRRPRMPAGVVDLEGEPVAYPDKMPEQIALEQNPNLMFEHWDEFWRKVHGARVMYQDGPNDTMLDTICTYYQVHRLPAAPSSLFSPPYQAPVDKVGRLYPVSTVHVPSYRRPIFDGLVYWGAPTTEDLMSVEYSTKAIDKINAEGNVFLRYAVSGLCAEYVIIPCRNETIPAFCTVKVHYCTGSTREAFQKMLLFEHSKYIQEKSATQKYVRRLAYIFNLNKTEKEPFATLGGMKIDAISVTYFDTMIDCERYYASDDYKAIEEREKEFLNMAESEWWTGVVYQFLSPKNEQVTDKNAQLYYDKKVACIKKV